MLASPMANNDHLQRDTSPSSKRSSGAFSDNNLKPSVDIPASSPNLLNGSEIDNILISDIGFEILLKRLKQSINVAEEFSKFVKKKAIYQEDHDNQTRKLSKNMREILRFAKGLNSNGLTKKMEELIGFDDKLNSPHSSYSKALFIMAEELSVLCGTMLNQRRNVKDEGRRREREFTDANQAAEKSNSRYFQLSLELDRLKSSDPNKRSFTIKGSKTGSQQEEELKRKIENSKNEYKSRSNTAQRLRKDLINIHRPANSKALKELILEMDTALSAQMAKYATWNETLIMQSGVIISPIIRDPSHPSMRSIAASINNEKDLYNYIMKHKSEAKVKQSNAVTYKEHVSSTSQYNSPSGSSDRKKSVISIGRMHSSADKTHQKTSSFAANFLKHNHTGSSVGDDFKPEKEKETKPVAATPAPVVVTSASSTFSASHSPPMPSISSPVSSVPGNGTVNAGYPVVATIQKSTTVTSVDTVYQTQPQQNSPPDSPQNLADYEHRQSISGVLETESNNVPPQNQNHILIFGTPIDQLTEIEGEMVPRVITKCIEVIDTFGLSLEGIYKNIGDLNQVKFLKRKIDENIENVNLLHPMDSSLETDLYSFASLLKLYFSELPEPILLPSSYSSFLEATKIQRAESREKQIHQAIYDLPDGSYWPLRSLVFHLQRIVKKQEINKMTPRDIGIIWAPLLLPRNNDITAEELSWQGKIIEEIIFFADDIFEPE